MSWLDKNLGLVWAANFSSIVVIMAIETQIVNKVLSGEIFIADSNHQFEMFITVPIIPVLSIGLKKVAHYRFDILIEVFDPTSFIGETHLPSSLKLVEGVTHKPTQAEALRFDLLFSSAHHELRNNFLIRYVIYIRRIKSNFMWQTIFLKPPQT